MLLVLSALLSPALAADPPPSVVEAMAESVAFNLQATVRPYVNGDKLEYRRSVPCPNMSGDEILLSIDQDGRRTLVVFATVSTPAGPFGMATITVGDRDADGAVDPDIGCGCDGSGVITATKLYTTALTCAMEQPY